MDDTPIEVVEYDPEWPDQFEQEAARISAALGDDLICIEHIGSTAVPGLAAKPVIDICPVVTDRKTAINCVDRLEEIGYEFGYDFENDRIHLGYTADNGQQYNLHLRWQDTIGGLEENILLREYLRDHPHLQDRYAALKREAAEEHTNDIEAYSERKTEFIQGIIGRAREEGYEEQL